MSRRLTTLAAALFVVSLAGSAHAISTKWCFRWQASYEDAGFGEDYLNSTGANEIAAKYARVLVQKWNSSTSSWEFPPLWNDWMDSTGCTGNVEVLPGTKYRFFQYLYLKRSTRYIHVHPDGEPWNGDTEYYYSELTTPSPMIVEPSYDAPIPPDSGNNRLMPAATQFLANASTLDYPDGNHVDVSTDHAAGGVCEDRGTGIVHESSHNYTLCVTNSMSDEKFVIVHELGHAVSHEHDSFVWGEHNGSEGIFNGGEYCDCSVIGDFVHHCPTSREFTGKGQLEGFSHFVSAASMNTRSHVSGWFVFYKDLHEATEAHYDDFSSMLEDPDADRESFTPHPVETPLNTSSNLKWTEYECDPTGEGFEHYGTEWDWLEFFWNLYTVGGTGVKFDVSEINDLWVDNGGVAFVCCVAHDGDPPNGEWIPDACVPRILPYACGFSPNPPGYSRQFEVGQLWEDDSDFYVSEGLIETAEDLYGVSNPTKYNHFVNTGIAARVNY